MEIAKDLFLDEIKEVVILWGLIKVFDANSDHVHIRRRNFDLDSVNDVARIKRLFDKKLDEELERFATKK